MLPALALPSVRLLQVLHGLWRFRGFVVRSVWRDVRAQSLGSVLGLAWLLVQPAAMVALYTLVFSHMMGARLPGHTGGLAYSVYLCAGLLPWQFFADGLARLQQVFVRHGNLLKKSAFPRLTLPAIELGIAGVQFALVTGVFLLVWLAAGMGTGWAALGALPALAVQVLLMAGLGLLAATAHVFFRDVGQALPVALVFWFWMTPIVYPLQTLSEGVRWWLTFNPMTVIVGFYQRALLLGEWPTAQDWTALAAVLGVALGLLALAWRLYRAHGAEMVDEL